MGFAIEDGRGVGVVMLFNSSCLVLLLLLFAGIAKLYYSKFFRHWYYRQLQRHGGPMYDRLAMYSNVMRQVLIIALIVAAPLVQWVFFKSQTWTDANELVNTRVTLTWVNYFLSMIYLAHIFMQYLGSVFNTPMSPMMGDQTAEMVLAMMGATTGTLDLAEIARYAHGWGAACSFADLGYTFRAIARDSPQSFPNGSKQELYCTESDLTFAQVFNTTTTTKWTDAEHAVLHDGGVCNLVCSLENSKGQLETTTYPIECANEGIALARWTLAAQIDTQKHRLCPSPDSPHTTTTTT